MLNAVKYKQKKVTIYSIMLMGLTSVHHLYGAIIYNTPWRMHVLLLSIPVIIVTLFLSRLLNKTKVTTNKYLFWVYWLITLLASITLIGVFEGLYNHILKNILYFGGLSGSLMNKIFPSGTYEMPNNFFFEITGMMQGIIVIPLIVYFIQLSKMLPIDK